MMYFQILLVVILASILADQGEGAVTDICQLTNSKIMISWFKDINSADANGQNKCTRKMAIRAQSRSDIVDYPCPQSGQPKCVQKNGVNIVDGVIYSDFDTPDKVFVVLGGKCTLYDFKEGGKSGDTTDEECKNIKVALKQEKSLKAVKPMKAKSLLRRLLDFIRRLFAKISFKL